MIFKGNTFVEASVERIPLIESSLPEGEGRPRLVVIIPAYNEERFIGSVVLKARKYSPTVIVVDDGSSDATAQVAADAGAIVLTHEHNQGKAAALNTAFQMVRDYEPEVVATLDADGQHSPDELLRVAE